MRAEFDMGCPRASRRDPSTRLLAELIQLSGGKGTLVRHQQRPWASITFSGTRHALTFAFAGQEAVETAETFLAALPDHEFVIPRQIVADVKIRTVDHVLLPEPRLTVDIELLVLEEA